MPARGSSSQRDGVSLLSVMRSSQTPNGTGRSIAGGLRRPHCSAAWIAMRRQCACRLARRAAFSLTTPRQVNTGVIRLTPSSVVFCTSTFILSPRDRL